MNYEKRLRELERRAAASKPLQYKHPRNRSDLTREEWCGLVAAGSDFNKDDIARVIQKRDLAKEPA